eukprot:6172807-Pleurochrysis_carterae.AAC.1
MLGRSHARPLSCEAAIRTSPSGHALPKARVLHFGLTTIRKSVIHRADSHSTCQKQTILILSHSNRLGTHHSSLNERGLTICSHGFPRATRHMPCSSSTVTLSCIDYTFAGPRRCSFHATCTGRLLQYLLATVFYGLSLSGDSDLRLIVGKGLYPLTIMRLKVLRWCVGRGKPEHPTITLPLSAAEHCHQIAANGRDDYGRASNKFSVWKGSLVIITTRSATSKAHDYTMRGQRQRALWATMPPCASGISSRTRRNRAMTQKCQYQNMQMRMNDNQSRNLLSQIDPRDRGSSASIARPRKLSYHTATTLYCRSNYLDRIYESNHPRLALYGMTD